MSLTNPFAASAVALVLASGASASNLLYNADFEIPSGLSTEFELTGYGLVGESVADEWYVFHNTQGTTLTRLIPSTISPGGTMLHVKTDGASNGIEQVLGAFDTGPACVEEGVWIYVEDGSVLIGAGNGGQTGADLILAENDTWTYVTASNSFCPVNLFIIYAASAGGASFYVDKASVEPLSCQGPPGDLNLDGAVNGADLAALLGTWGPCTGCNADLNHDSIVNGADLAILLANWGC
ncbi:MAG: dockerin type I repeat-containing protein [Phycisphaerae bacterium]|nr:dockerin type I repeat-containing protein [Phycisphaerae bacterium]